MDVFQQMKLNSTVLSNRILMAPVKTGFATAEGEVTYNHEEYYRRRAEGGAAGIIVEPLYIDIRGKEHPKQIGISSYQHVEGLSRLANAIHEGGSMAIAHLNHGGRAANPKLSGNPPEAPSVVECKSKGTTPVEMTVERIEKVVLGFAGSARRALEAGFDIIEIQFGLGYLIAQFLSPRTNLRKDAYGGAWQNRYRFAREVLAAVREEIGPEPALIARISAAEQVEGGLGIEDAIELAKFLEDNGISAVHVVSGSICDSPPWYFQHMRLPAGKNLEWANLIKKEVNLPVIVAGRMGDPGEIRNAIGDEIVDAVALGRPLIADPDLPLKMKENRDEDVIQCGACLQGCLVSVKSGAGIKCIINPEVGNESGKLKKTGISKTVVVVGGGPGGIQAAWTASQRGHKVVLFDKGELGGAFNLSYLPPGKGMMKRPLSSLVHRIKQSSVDLRLSTEASIDNVLAEHPDTVIIATGARPIKLKIPGLNDSLSGVDVLTGRKIPGNQVLIIGGGMVGLECAEFLANRGHAVTVTEIFGDVARDMEQITKKLTMAGLNRLGVKILTRTEVSRFEGKTAFIKKEHVENRLGEFDSVVVAVGTSPVDDYVSPLREMGINVVIIGDAKKPGQISNAVTDGYEAAVAI
ncbi:MAG: NAD(P)-binding protein [candidate division Zixibacteria bacterium]|nr:NAD(P)-binding protein [candidate division Zixibacteria bacterium]